MSNFQGRVAIVSGASSGIGEATAMRLGRDAADLVLLASPGDREDLSRVENQLPGSSLATFTCCTITRTRTSGTT